MSISNSPSKPEEVNRMDAESLDEDLYREKVPSRFSQYLDEDSFEKFKYRNKEWE